MDITLQKSPPLIGPIKFAIGHCVEGYVLVARSEVGICAIVLDDDAEGLRQHLHEASPGTSLSRRLEN